MDLNLFFTPVDEALTDEVGSISSFCRNITVNTHKVPDLQGFDLALIGLTEKRGSGKNKGVGQAADEIRKKLYRLKRGSGAYHIIDLGNLNNGVELEETYGRLQEVCEYLISRDILPVIIGGSHDLTLGQFYGYQGLEKLISVLNVDALLDLNEEGEPSQTHLHKMLVHEPNYLFNYSHLAYQTYLIETTAIEVLERLYFETYRVGMLRTRIEDMEPVIREADMLTFDITAIRSSDAPGNANAQPFGLTGEEACQICWYAGLNDKLSSAGFYEYNPALDDDSKKTAAVVATMIWYFVEGFYHRQHEGDFRSNDYLRYVVDMPGNEPASIVFYKSKLSDKWWLEIPSANGKRAFGRNSLVPCSYNDFKTASNGEVPDRYVNAVARLSA
ncbi:MAG TPA: formiminoglutamase [Flammeovirgaceae bacterium]|nr:formiminoglutamase [Flammeovirgaceae bacterium]